jgi:hypothetical protein
MPRPKRMKGMAIWDRLELDAAFEALTDEIGKLNLIDEYLKETKDD